MRSWEGTRLKDTPRNRRIIEARAVLIDQEIKEGTFNYTKRFPHGSKIHLFQAQAPMTTQVQTAGTFYEGWILKKIPPLVRKSAERDYRQHFNRYILPKFKDVELFQINSESLETFRHYLLHEQGLKLKTVRNIFDGSFRAMMRDAGKIHKDLTNPFLSLQWHRTVTARRDPFTEDERDMLLAYWTKKLPPRDYAFIYSLFWTGMRPSEATALRIGDLDLKRGRAEITKSRYLDEESATKTAASNRVIYLPPALVEILEDIVPLRSKDTDYAFTNKDGRPIKSGDWPGTHWFPALKANKIRPRNFYQTKHTFISLALSSGINIKLVSEQVGSSVATIERHYGKYIQSQGDDPWEAMRSRPTARKKARGRK